MPIKSECLKISSQTSIIYLDQYFFYAMQHYYYTGITQCNQFYHLKTEFFKIIDKPHSGILWLYHWYSVLILVFNFH
jgi:hypothetical protein